MTAKHTPEPWRLEFHPAQAGNPATLIMQAQAAIHEKWLAECPFGEDLHTDRPGDGKRDCTAAEAQANARRIVACVNALAGVPTELLEELASPGGSIAGLFAERTQRLSWQLKGWAVDPALMATDLAHVLGPGWSVRLRKALSRANMKTVGDLVKRGYAHLRDLKNCGPATIKELCMLARVAGFEVTEHGTQADGGASP